MPAARSATPERCIPAQLRCVRKQESKGPPPKQAQHVAPQLNVCNRTCIWGSPSAVSSPLAVGTSSGVARGVRLYSQQLWNFD